MDLPKAGSYVFGHLVGAVLGGFAATYPHLGARMRPFRRLGLVQGHLSQVAEYKLFK
jgi:hypothetical protein